MIDVVFLARNRLEFTKASLAALKANTDWSRARLIVYDDGSTDGTYEWLLEQGKVIRIQLGSPVAVMNDYLSRPGTALWAKIDNDVIVPPGWLDECERVMLANPSLELLGIEAMSPLTGGSRSFTPSGFIGGIGLFRRSAWARRPEMIADGRFGFTAWQDKNHVRVGWITPALPVFLLNRLPFEPWLSLSREYVRSEWQRALPGPYDPRSTALWDWWTNR